MEYSKRGLALTEGFEGCRLQSYRDAAGVWTIGYGHTAGVGADQSCTREQAEAWLSQDIDWAAAAVNREVTVELTQGEFDALVDFIYNLGSGTFARSDVLRLLNGGDYAGAERALGEYARASGQVLAGLLRRRAAEQAEFDAAGNP